MNLFTNPPGVIQENHQIKKSFLWHITICYVTILGHFGLILENSLIYSDELLCKCTWYYAGS